MKNRKKFLIIFTIVILVFAVAFLVYKFFPSRGATGLSDYRVDEGSELIYYIDVIYDGKDAAEVTSSDSAIAAVISDYIYVEDKLPVGVEYLGVVEPTNCTYGAVRRSDGTTSCSGYVVGAREEDGECVGINYDSNTRIVSFIVKGLQAGCKLTVGIRTQTTTLSNETRLDLYNEAYAWEETFTAKSNPVHVFMGDIDENSFQSVSYQYSSTINGVTFPELPVTRAYHNGTTVEVAKDLVLEGYEFSGWTTSDVTVANDDTFVVPNNDVVFTATFTPKSTHSVTYSVSNTILAAGYVPPETKYYGTGDNVSIDSIEDDILPGYTFEGWTSNDVDTSSGTFVMPNQNVTLTGNFSVKRYNVTYAYRGTSLPSQWEATLPDTESYVAGAQVTLSDPEAYPQGYTFLGWYNDTTFTMPDHDIIVYGEWAPVNSTFTPSISMTTQDNKTTYADGDEVEFIITVTNSQNYAIQNVVVEELLADCPFDSGNGYTVTGANSNFAEIASIAANSSVTLTATYQASLTAQQSSKSVNNEVAIVAATSTGNRDLDTSNDITAEFDITISRLKVVINTVNSNNVALTDSEYTLYSDSTLQTVVGTPGTEFEGLETGVTYYLKQTYVNTGYSAFAGPAQMQISANGTVTVDNFNVSHSNGIATVTIVNDVINVLPYTGGVGTIPFIIGGFVVIIGSVIGYIIYIKKNKKKDRVNDNEK